MCIHYTMLTVYQFIQILLLCQNEMCDDNDLALILYVYFLKFKVGFEMIY